MRLLEFSRFLDLRHGEGLRVFRMFSLLGLIIATSYVLKPVRSALFLSEFGSEKLPYVYILVAIVLGFVAAGFARWAPHANLPRLFVGASALFASNLVLFWAATISRWPYTGFLFYVWVSIVTALMPSLFWLLANYVFYANEGRRLFPLVMAGGLLGSILGGAVTSLLVPLVGTSGLMLVAALLLTGVAALIRTTTTREKERMTERRSDLARQERSRTESKEQRPWHLITRSRYLSLVAGSMILGTLVATLLDYQFNTVVERSFASRDALTSFFGAFFAAINVAAFFLQILLTGRLLNRLGVGAGLLLLPSALLLSSVAFLAHPVLVTAALVKSADDGLSNSVNRASVEVLYLPIALSLKNRLKAWIDLFVERVSRGLGGLLILLATSVLSLSVRQLSFAVIALVVPWIAIVLRLRRAYVETLRDSLARRDIGDLSSTLGDPASLAVFHQVLGGTDEKQILYALDLLRGTDDETILADAVRLASHSRPEVRTAALRALRAAEKPPLLDEMERRVQDENVGAGAEALALWLRVSPEAAREAFASLVELAEVERLGAVLDSLEGSEALLPPDLLNEIVFGHCRSEDPACRKLAAKAIGFLPQDSLGEAEAIRLLRDPDVEVARPAATSAGKLRLASAFNGLVRALGRPALRAHARRAIARYGEPALEEIERLLLDEPRSLGTHVALPPNVRRALPRAIAEFEEQRSVQALFASLPSEDGPFHYQAVKSLARLNARAPGLRFPRSEVDRLLGHERETLLALSRMLAGLSRSPSAEPSERLLVAVLGERVEFTRERIFRLFGLLYPQKEIAALWNRIVSGPPSIRAAALEYLSNLLSRRHRASLFGILEAGAQPEAVRRGVTLEGDPAPSREQAVRELLESSDDWILACSVTVVGVLGLRSLFPHLEALRNHPEAAVREAVERALEKHSRSR